MAQFGDFTVDRNSTKYVLGSGGDIISYATDEPAFEFNADGSYKGLLVEPAATNVCKQSEDINTTWSPSNATITTNATTAPDGTTTADKLEATATGSGAQVNQNITTSAGTYTFSVWLKEGNTTTTAIRLTDAGTADTEAELTWATRTVSGTGGVTARVVTDLGSGDWIRISLTYTLPAGGSDVVRIFAGASTGATAGEYVHVWGAQFEASPIATSYIPTTTASVTRTKDDITLGSASSLIGQTEGTLYVEVDWRGTGANQLLLSANDGTSNNRIVIYNNVTPVELRMAATADGSLKTNQGVSSTGFSGIQKIAFAYKTDDFELYRNGSSISSDTTGSLAALATLTDIDLGQQFDAGAQANMWIRAVALYPKRLSDAECEALTTL
jgi:hypothetical protein